MISLSELSEQFGELGLEPSDEVLAKCIDLCVTYNITDAVEFVEQWVSYSVSHLHGAEPTVQFLLEMERKELAHRKEASSKKAKAHIASINSYDSNAFKLYGSPGTSQLPDQIDHDDDIMDSYCKTPKAPKTALARTPARHHHHHDTLFSPISYSPVSGTPRSSQPERSGSAVCTFGSSNLIKQTTWSSTRQEKIQIKQLMTYNNETLNVKSKYMHDCLIDKCTQLGDRLFHTGTEICKKVFGPETIEYDLHHVDVPSQDTVKSIGRICCDFDGKLDPGSTNLIGADETKFRTVRLNFSKTKSFSVFPGQTVMVSGKNPRGDTIYVEEILAEKTIEAPCLPQLIEPITFVIAAGPFTNHDDLVYDPLQDLLLYCKDHKPDIVIMAGPFIDAEHKMISKNVLAETFESFFEKLIAGIVEKLGETTICIVSSQKDAVSNMVYPTPPNFISRKLYPNVHMLPDPCIIDINSLKIGITSTDIYNQIAQEELAVNAGDKVKRIVKHLLHQESFYPLNPPALDFCFDSDLTSKYAKIEVPPNVLILPSEQKSFIRDVHGCLAINPGHLTNQKTTGTYARLVVHPTTEETNLLNYAACQVIKM